MSRGQLRRAARLLGAAERLDNDLARARIGFEYHLNEATRARIREGLGEEDLADGLVAGREMAQTDAIDYALSGARPPTAPDADSSSVPSNSRSSHSGQ